MLATSETKIGKIELLGQSRDKILWDSISTEKKVGELVYVCHPS
jgi:hypothetical protein